MKPLPIVLALSLTANAVLAFVYWRPVASKPAPAGTPPAAAAPVARPLTLEEEVAAALRADPEFAEAARSGDPHRMRPALIRAGFPDTYVRDMVTFHMSNAYSPERLELLRREAEKPFWQITPGEELVAMRKGIQELDRKSGELAKEVFGGKVPPHPLEALTQQRRYRFLPAEKAEAVARIDSDYAEMESELRRAGSSPDALEKARLLQQERRADLSGVLSPAELELYDLTLSPTAQTMRRELALFQPTEEEFRKLFQIRRTVDEKYPPAVRMSPADMRTRMQDTEAVNRQAREFLGEQRYLEYERARDYGYRAAVEIVKHFQLPEDRAAEAYALQKSALKQAQEIQMSAGADRAQAAARITQLVTETEGRLVQLLGAPGAEAYKRTGGTWLGGLQRSTAAPRAPVPPGP